MNYGFHLATGGMLSATRRMDTIANNLANANTIGFKPDFVIARERPAERLERNAPLADPLAPPQEVLERLGGGVRFERDRIDLRQGSIERTGSPTDLAIRGDGFFVLAGPGDSAPAARAPLDLSRDGRMIVAPNGSLRRAVDGRALIGERGRPIRLDPTLPFGVDESGRIFQDGSEVARLRLVRPTDPAALEKAGGNVYRAAAVERVPESDGGVMQYAVESSTADPVRSMVEMIRQSRLFEANVRMLQYQDNMNAQAITGLARLA